MIGFCDNDWKGSEEVVKNIYGYACTFCSGIFFWVSVKQQCVALFIAETEYINALEAIAQATWLRFVIEDFGEVQTNATLNCDKTSVMHH